MSDTPKPERDLDPAALDELMRAFTDHRPDRDESVQPGHDEHREEHHEEHREEHHDEELESRADDDDLEPTAPTPVAELMQHGPDDEGAHGAADQAGDDQLRDNQLHDATPPAAGRGDSDPDAPAGRPTIRIGNLDEDLPDPPGVHEPSESWTPSDRAPAEPRVIAIDDADLPDAVYVQGSLDAGGSRGLIVIEDDESGHALRPESERDLRRGIEPRMRERRLAVKRAKGRKRLIWVGIGVAVLIVVVAALAVVGSGLFAVEADEVVVTGQVYTDDDALQAVIDDLVGTPVLRVDTAAAEAELERIAWVDEARVRVEFPHSATIEIREREALTTYQGPDGRFRVLDREGRVLDVIELYPLAYVLIDGPDPVDLELGQFAPRGYAAASELAKSLTGSVRGRVDHIDVTADGSDLSMVMNNGTEVRFGEARELIAKLVRLETVLAEMRREAIETGADPDNLGGPDTVIDVSTSETTR